MPPHIQRLPTAWSAHAFLRRRFEGLSDAEMAEVDFGPWELADLCGDVPTPKAWPEFARSAQVTLRLAAEMVRLDKAGMVERTSGLEGRGLDELSDQLAQWTDTLRAHAALLEAAQDRLIIAMAVLHGRADGAPAGSDPA